MKTVDEIGWMHGKRTVEYEDRFAVDGLQHWKDILSEFLAGRKKVCGRRVFDRVEHVGFYSHAGRNMCLSELKKSYNRHLFDIEKWFDRVKFVTLEMLQAEGQPDFRFPKQSVRNVITKSTSVFVECYNMEYSQRIIPKLVFEKIPRRYHHFESHLLNAILHGNHEVANHIINTCCLDIDYFYLLWCSFSDTAIKRPIESISIFVNLKKKYPRWDMKRFPINSITDFELLQENGFNISLEENITTRFVKSCNEGSWKYLADRINWNSIGTYKLNILHIIPEINDFQKEYLFNEDFALNIHAKDTYYGIPASFITFYRSSKVLSCLFCNCLNDRDSNGNNIMHYTNIYNHDDTHTLSEEELKLIREKNHQGIPPLAILTYLTIPFDLPEWNEPFKTNHLPQSPKNKLRTNATQLTPFHCYLIQNECSPDAVKNHPVYSKHLNDYSLRDEYGKHLFHYSSQLIPKISIYEKYLMKDEGNGRYPLEPLYTGDHNMFLLLAKPSFDLHAQADNSGKFYLHQLLEDVEKYEEPIKTEARFIAFDYTLPEAQLLTLKTFCNEETFGCAIHKYPLPRMENGDDISHDMARQLIRPHQTTAAFTTMLNFTNLLIRRGMRMNKTRNSSGQTAWDILTTSSGGPICPSVLKTLRKGNSKSMAKMKFNIQAFVDRKKFTFYEKDRLEARCETYPGAHPHMALLHTKLHVTKYF